MVEKKKRGRGIKLIYIISPVIPEKDRQNWKYTLATQSGITDYFDKVDVTFYEPEKGKMEVKIFCPKAKFMIEPSKVKALYFDGFKPVTDWIGDTFAKNASGKKYKILGSSFEVVFVIWSANPNAEAELVPLEYFDFKKP